jgi:hypothetical protein
MDKRTRANENGELIWKMAQGSYQKGFKARTRSKELKFGLVEKDRVSSLFRATGNLHVSFLTFSRISGRKIKIFNREMGKFCIISVEEIALSKLSKNLYTSAVFRH